MSNLIKETISEETQSLKREPKKNPFDDCPLFLVPEDEIVAFETVARQTGFSIIVTKPNERQRRRFLPEQRDSVLIEIKVPDGGVYNRYSFEAEVDRFIEDSKQGE